VVIATHNPGKLKEMRELLAPYGIATQSAGELGLPEPEETGKTFAANARIKAVAAARASRAVAFADDSGLVVDALDGDPGIHSARWAGPDKDFRAAMNRIQTLLDRARCQNSRAASCAFCCRIVSRRGPMAMLRNSKAGSTASPSGRRVATKVSVTIRFSVPTALTGHSVK
jgi:non-canonical purine NTP pyrophosphatase (RdgB/HAM1 family)